MTAVAAQRHVLLKQQVEEFLYAEAALLDAWALDDWLLLFDEDAKYEVPCNDAPEGDPAWIAAAMTWMFERCCHQLVVDDASAESAAMALAEILWRTVTYRAPGSGS